MKNLILILVGVLFLTTPAFSELTDSDLQRIREIVQITVVAEVKQIRTEMLAAIDASEKRMKEYVDTKISEVNTRISEVNTRISGLNNRIDELGKRMNIVFIVLGWLLALVLVTLGIPQLITAFRHRGDDNLRTEIKELRAEIELLKQGIKPQPEAS